MNRRDISMALLACPVLARGTEGRRAGRVYRVGWLGVSPPGPSNFGHPVWLQTMAKLGWVVEDNVVVIYMYTDRAEQLPDLVAEMIRLRVDVIVAVAAPQTEAAKQATRTIPILFVVHGDPVGRGHVASLARPGGNITGVSQMLPELCVKRVQLLKQLIPGASRIAVLRNIANPAKDTDWLVTQDAARDVAFKLEPCAFTGPDDFEAALELVRNARADALLTLEDPLTFRYRKAVVEFAGNARLPVMHGLWGCVEIGGLISFYIDENEFYRLNAYYLDKILRGAKPADLPVARPTTFTLALNLKTAKALDLQIPRTILTRADVVIS